MKSILLVPAAVCLLLCAQTARGDGFVIVHPTPELPAPVPLAVRYHHVDIDVRSQVAHVSIDQVFNNPNSRTLEGEYLFPVPAGAAVSDFALYVDGEPVHAQAMDAEQALSIYTALVRERHDPALLEYAGRELFRARIFPLPAFGDRRVKLAYEHVIERQGGMYRLVYPLATEKYSSRPLESVYVRMEIDADRPILNVYSPSHDIDVTRIGHSRVRVSWEESSVTPDRDLVLYYALADGPIDIRVIPYRPDASDDGYFMLLAQSGVETAVLPKDVTFVIDHSGSMNGEKIEQAQAALIHCLSHLNPADRFNIVSFNDDVDLFASERQPATRREVRRAIDFVRDLEAEEGTNIDAALAGALREGNSHGRPSFIVFLTDGMATVGERDPAAILEHVAEVNERVRGSHRHEHARGRVDWEDELRSVGARIFPFGIGYDVNSVFLDQLAIENGGAPTYVRPNEDLESKIATFYDSIAEPLLTGVTLTADGARLRSLEPSAMPDLFRGGQLVLFGRYRSHGPVTIHLRGRASSGDVSFSVTAELPERESANGFIGRLWATRRVGTLLRAIRLHGEEEELVAEVKSLGLRFGIATPYTSFLVDENGHGRGDFHVLAGRNGALDKSAGPPIRMRSTTGGGTPSMSFDMQATQPATGQASFEASRYVAEMSAAKVEKEMGSASEMRFVVGRTYRRDGEVWRDTSCPDDVDPKELLIGSDEYFTLLSGHPELGSVLALGKQVVFEIVGRWYRTVAR